MYTSSSKKARETLSKTKKQKTWFYYAVLAVLKRVMYVVQADLELKSSTSLCLSSIATTPDLPFSSFCLFSRQVSLCKELVLTQKFADLSLLRAGIKDMHYYHVALFSS